MSQEGKFTLEVVTPSRHLVSENVDEITVPGAEGEFGVLEGHTPFLTALGVGEFTYRVGGEEKVLAVRKGFAEVTRDRVTVLAEEAEFRSEIDLQHAEQTLAEAEEAIKELSQESKEYLEAQAKLERAMYRVQVAKGA